MLEIAAKLDIIIKTRYKSRPYFLFHYNYLEGKDLIMSKLDKDLVIAAFTQAYTTANGKAPEIEAKGGWYSVDGGKNIRLAALNDMISELGTSNKEGPTAPKTPTKKKAASKAKSSGFSVKSFYATKIQTENEGVKLPR